jgi:hypothetical protein
MVALPATAMAVVLHVVFLTQAGGLWRDEAAFVQLATAPTWSDLWQMLGHDHCPILMPAVLRAWCAAGWGNTDFGLRLLGLIIGLLLLAAFWVASRMMRRGVPLLPLALVALNVIMIRAGDSLRGYGLGSALNVLTLALLWRVALKPTGLNVSLGALAAVFSVQCLYQNAFFVAAAVGGAVVVCTGERRRRDALWPLGIGALAALSLVPYIRMVRGAQEWYLLNKTGFNLAKGWTHFSSATGFEWLGFGWLWLGLCLAALAVFGRSVAAAAPPVAGMERRNLIRYGTTALVTGVAGFVVFLELSDLPTQPWYYTPLLAFMAACLDGILPAWHRRVEIVLLVVTALAIGVAMKFGLPELKRPRTNVNIIAARLAREAAPGDYIVVYPWYAGITFERYYQGSAPWSTLPPIADHRVHRYDLFKMAMQLEHPLQPVLDKIAATLQSGHRVWIVGNLPLSRTPPPKMRPAPNNPWGWFDEPYSQIWGAQAGCYISTHADEGLIILMPSDDGLKTYEELPVTRITGWRPPSPAPSP